jgi:hypothetical protein
MKKIKYLFGLILLTPVIALAHVKWFAEEENIINPYSIHDNYVLIGIIIALAIVILGIYLEKKLNVPHKLDKTIQKWAPGVLSIASIGFGLLLLFFQ